MSDGLLGYAVRVLPPTLRARLSVTGLPFYYGWVIVGAALATQFIAIGAQTGVIGAFTKPMTEALGWSRSELFLSESIAQLVMAAIGIRLGPYVDRLGPRPVMLVGIVILVPALLLISQVTELWQWLILRGFILAAGAAFLGLFVASVAVSKWFVTFRGRALGFASMGVSLAGVVWPLLATASIDGLGWRGAWALVAGVALVMLIPASLLMRRQPEDYGLLPDGGAAPTPQQRAAADLDYRESMDRRAAVRTRAFYLITLSFGLSIVGVFGILTQGIPFLTDNGFSAGEAAALSSTMSFFAMVTKPPWGAAADRWNPRVLAAVGFVIAGTGTAVLVPATQSGSLPLVALAMTIVGIGWGGNIPIHEVLWASTFGRRHLGAVRGLGFPFAAGIASVTPLGLATYFDQVGDYAGAFYFCAGLWFIAFFLILFLRRPLRPSAPPGTDTEVSVAGSHGSPPPDG
ncbi:MAG: Nitrate/nitrite transporter NarK [Chloroflexi bacterium]|nr:MAG: Nitrate/nitrite transporter NarK [Chloroflexota bacterium]